MQSLFRDVLQVSHALRTRLAAHDGFALPVAIAVLLVISLLGAAAVAVSESTSSSTMRDQRSKTALEAAEAGLRVATYRLSMIDPLESLNCVSSTKEIEPTGGTYPNAYCASGGSESLGNGATYSYWTSAELQKSSKCVGMTMSNQEEERVKEEGVEQRCITAEGTVGGISARVQARVATFSAKPLFPVPAVIAKNKIELEGTTTVNSGLATNGLITGTGNVSQGNEYHCELGPNGKYEGVSPLCNAQKQRTAAEGPFSISPADPGSSATISPLAANCELVKPPKENCDARIENGIFNAAKKSTEEARTPYDQIANEKGSTNSVTFTSSTREMRMTGGTWTLGAGVYNFCNFEATKGTIAVAAGVKAAIYIEGYNEPQGSGCPAGSGKFSFTGNVSNPSGDPTALQIYVYGKGPVKYTGTTNTAMTLYAPEASVTLTGNSTLTGGITGNEIKMSGKFMFDWSKEDAKLKLGEAGAADAYYRSAWAQCTPTAPATEPTSGC